MKYLIAILAAFADLMLYGLFVGGDPSLIIIPILFVSIFGVLAFFERKDFKTKLTEKIAMMVLFSAFIMAFSVIAYLNLNELTGTVTDEYEAEITRIEYYRTSDDLYFNDPEGTEKYVDYTRPFFGEREENIPQEGDTIAVQEVTGLFRIPYCRLAESDNGNLNILIFALVAVVFVSIVAGIYIVDKKEK